MVRNLLTLQETWVRFLVWVRKIPWRKEWQPTPVFLPGEFYGQRSLVGYSSRGHKKVRHDWATNILTFTDTTPPTLHLYSVTLGVCLSCVLSCSVVSVSLQPHGLQPARLLCLWDPPGKNTGVGCYALLQPVFPTQGSNPRLLVSCIGREALYH